MTTTGFSENIGTKLRPKGVKRRGRPSTRGQVDVLRTKLWSHYATSTLGIHNTGYALGYYLEPEKYRKVDEGIVRPKKHDNHMAGKNVPREDHVAAVEIKVPGTKYYFEHPFWSVARYPISGHEELYTHLQKLRPEIVDLLFFSKTENGLLRRRKNYEYVFTFSILSEEADWDALTACIGLIQEIRLYGETSQYIFYTKPVLDLTRRVLFQEPFYHIANEIFEYLKETFLIHPECEETNTLVNSLNLDFSLLVSRLTLSMIDDYRIFRHYVFPPPSCLYIAERYLSPELVYYFTFSRNNEEVEQFIQSSLFSNLKRSLRRWEAKRLKSTTSYTPTPVNGSLPDILEWIKGIVKN